VSRRRGLAQGVTNGGAWPRRGCAPKAEPDLGAGRAAAPGAMAADGDWQDFYEFQEPPRSPQDKENCNASPEVGAGADGGSDGFPALACSLEEKLSLCFRPSGPGAEPPRAAVRPITERSLLQGDE
jgi:hypothetical protein